MKLTINRKLTLYTSLVVVLLLAICFSIFRSFGVIQQIIQTSLQLKDVQVNIVKLREAEKNMLLWDVNQEEFYKNDNSTYLSQFTGKLDDNLGLIKIIKDQRLSESFGLIKGLDQLIQLHGRYKEKFSQLSQLKKEKGFKDYGVIGEMRIIMHRLETNYTALRAQVNVLKIRRHEKDYLLRKDPAYLDLIREAANSAKAGSSSAFTADIEQYLNLLDKLADIDGQIGYNETTGLNQELARINKQIYTTTTNLIDDVNRESDAGRRYSSWLIGILIAVGTVITILAAIWIIKGINRSIQKAIKTITSVSNGELSVKIDASGQDEIGDLLVSIKKMITKLRDIVGTVVDSSNNIVEASKELSKSSQLMSDAAAQQASAAEEVSSSMEEMAANIDQNAYNAKETERIANNGSSNIEESNYLVERTLESMKLITQNISIVDEISRQTNLLALNAAVEAARAGEHGRGFAVVAAEIRRLAERSQDAAKDINEKSKMGVEMAETSSKLLGNTTPEIKKTAMLVKEISSASIEQNNGADQVNGAIQNLNQIIQQNAAIAEQMAANSQNLHSHADLMIDTVSFFKLDGSFIGKIIADKAAMHGYSNKVSTVADKEEDAASVPDVLSSNGSSTENGSADQSADTDTPKGIDIDLSDDADDGDFEKF